MNSIDKKKNLKNPQPKFTGCFDDFLIISISNEENKIQKEKKETKNEDKNKEIINCGDVENFLSNFPILIFISVFFGISKCSII